MTKEELKILICDDSILARKFIKDSLKRLECENVEEAKDGQSSIDKYSEFKPHIVFLDIIMPNKNGVEVTQEIMDSNPDATIVIISSVGTKQFLEDALSAGAKDFIQKPFTDESIAKVIDKYISNH